MYARMALLLLSLSFVSPRIELAAGDVRAAAPDRADSPVANSRPGGPLILEDPLELLVPKRPRSEADRDRVEAIALFATGRMLERRRKYADALRHYQRALRCDPEAATVANTIVPLAYGLNRHAQAARYALKAEDVHAPLLRSLASHQWRSGDYREAVALFEKAMAGRRGRNETAAVVDRRLSLGRRYHLIEEYEKAADCFDRVSYALEHTDEFGIDQQQKKQLLGEPGPTYNLFGESLLLAGRLDKAAAAFEKAHQLDPNEGLLHFNLARVHARQDQPEKAIAGLQTCFKERLTGEGMAPYRLLAKVLKDLGKSDELIGRLEKLHGDQPDNVPLAYFLAETYLEADKLSQAESLCRASIEKAPALSGYRNLIEIYRKTERPEALLEILGDAVEKTGVLGALGAEAQAVAADADLMHSVVEAARKKLEADSGQLDYGMRLAVALLALESKQFDTAGEFFELAHKAKPDQAAELLLTWGVGLLVEEQNAEAIKVFGRAIDEKALPDDNPTFYHYYAGALALDGRTDEALAAAKQAVDRARKAAVNAAEKARDAERALVAAKPDARPLAAERAFAAAARAADLKGDWARFRSRRGWALYVAKRYDESIKAYQRLLDDFDSDYGSTEVREVLRDVRLAMSNICVIQEDLQPAQGWLDQVLDEFPDDVGASNDLGYLWADQNKHLARALKMIRHAVDAEPDNVAYRDSLGWIFYRLGRYDEAVVELEKAVKQQKLSGGEEPDPLILDHLGDAQLEAGRPEKAKDAWRRAVEAFKKNEEPEKAKAVEEKIKRKS